MIIKNARFISSVVTLDKCPPACMPEYAFIGRSNVGKSSLINMLLNAPHAKTSSTPGKTQTINHFIINETWYMVDLPGYGYAKQSKSKREKWHAFISSYLLDRKNLLCIFVLIDARLKPQRSDLDFMLELGNNQIPFVMAFTKSDKVKPTELKRNIAFYNKEMLKSWEEIPRQFITSAQKKGGREEILDFIDETNKLFINN